MSDWELLVVDDGSTDSSAAQVESLASTDDRIKLLRQPHIGTARSCNLALEHARGPYVAFLDPDSSYRPHYLRTAIAAMHGRGWNVAYAIAEVRQGRTVRYGGLDLGHEMLELTNHVDLNATVARRMVVDKAGRFDEQLEARLDYDLLLRLDQLHHIQYLPFVGITRNQSADGLDSANHEPSTWLEIVQNKNLIDWNAQSSDRVAGRVSVLISTHEDWHRTLRCLDTLMSASRQDDLEIVVLDNASRRSVGTILEAVAATDRRINLIREPLVRGPALGLNLAFSKSTGSTVVFLGKDAEVQPDWLEPVQEELNNDDVLAVQPILLNPEGSIQCAGMAAPTRGDVPLRFLADHPIEDARRLGSSFDVPALTRTALACRADDFAAVRGFDPIYRNGWADIDLCLRLAQLRPATLRVLTKSVVIRHASEADEYNESMLSDREIFQHRWQGRTPPDDQHLWRAAGFDVVRYRIDKPVGQFQPEIATPVLVRETKPFAAGHPMGRPALRWAIKIGAPAGREGTHWGDVHFARALGASLRRLGQEVVIDSRGAANRESAYLDDVVLVLHGRVDATPQPGRVNLLWVISHPDLIRADDMPSYDAIFAASSQWAARMSDLMGRHVETLLQCTEPARFHPDVAIPDTGHNVLFIGNSRNVVRPIVRDAIRAGADVAVYGTKWERFIDHRYIRGAYVPNEELAAAYRSARVVLNDHWEDMRREGFVSNRVFDAAATGARVVSDDMPGLVEVFGGLVRTYRSVDELRDMLNHAQDVFPSEEARVRLAETVRQDHSFDVRAQALLDAAIRHRKQ